MATIQQRARTGTDGDRAKVLEVGNVGILVLASQDEAGASQITGRRHREIDFRGRDVAKVPRLYFIYINAGIGIEACA